MNSKLIIIEVAMNMENPELCDIYFGNNAVLHYQEPPFHIDNLDVPFLIVGMKKGLSEDAATEFMLNCPEFKKFHKMLFGKEVRTFITTEGEIKKLKSGINFSM